MNTQTDDAPSTPRAPLSDESRKRLAARRRLYLAILLVMVGLSIAATVTKDPQYLLYRLPVAAIFVTVFLGVAREVMGYAKWLLFVMGAAILLMPFAGTIVLLTVDRNIYERLGTPAPGENGTTGAMQGSTPWTHAALVTCWIPLVGLTCSITALLFIRRSAGALRGKGLAVFALIVSILFTVIMGGAFLSVIIDPSV